MRNDTLRVLLALWWGEKGTQKSPWPIARMMVQARLVDILRELRG